MVVPNDFQSRYCKVHGVMPENYANEVLKRAFYPHARWALFFLRELSPYFLQADYDFIFDVGRITRFRHFEPAVEAYFDHPMNKNNPLRRRLLLRISTARLRRLVREVLLKEQGGQNAGSVG